jgi:hypothetical protein
MRKALMVGAAAAALGLAACGGPGEVSVTATKYEFQGIPGVKTVEGIAEMPPARGARGSRTARATS